MEQNAQLRQVFFDILNSGAWKDRRHLKTCIDMLIGLILSGSVNLTKWIPFSSGRGKIAQSIQRRYIRWLDNSNINVMELYQPLISAALTEWGNSAIYLAFDTSMLWNTYCMIRVSIVYRGRAIPLAWDVIQHNSSAVAFGTYKKVLKQAKEILEGHNKRVVLLADRGFADTKLMALCRRYKWGYRIRLKGTFQVIRPGEQERSVDLLCPALRGNALFLHNVRITRDKFGLVSLALAYDKESGERWYIVSDVPTSPQTFKEYGLRFDIEENFLDDKSNGFQLESSGISTAAGLNRLCFILAVATLYLVAQGTEVVEKKQRRLIDPHWFRGNSYLRIGWDWLKRTLYQGGEFLARLRLHGRTDPDPAKASRKQAEKRALRFTSFNCNTLIYNE
jgi:hypothetical protein